MIEILLAHMHSRLQSDLKIPQNRKRQNPIQETAEIRMKLRLRLRLRLRLSWGWGWGCPVTKPRWGNSRRSDPGKRSYMPGHRNDVNDGPVSAKKTGNRKMESTDMEWHLGTSIMRGKTCWSELEETASMTSLFFRIMSKTNERCQTC